jgi:signal transduction histidine kinase
LEIHLFWAFLIVSLIGIGFGLLTGNRVIAPLNRLLNLVEKSSPDNLPSGFSQVFKNDEFGTLARAFESSFRRIQQFIKRENQFTRDASHELRTPVTVIKGAVELLNMTPVVKDEMSQKLIKRIERSTLDMETTIETLLWLARESNPKLYHTRCELTPLVQNAMAQNQHLIANKAIEMTFSATHNPIIAAPPGVVLIAVSNLIRNACQYTLKGFIKITVKADRVEVADSGPGIAQTDPQEIEKPTVIESGSKGFGFGLDIVNRLCERFGWQLLISSKSAEGTTACLVFPGNPLTT